jgi:electron transfer flavoprotein alpha subunit
MASVCIIAEHYQGKLKKATFHSITFGRQAAKKIGADLHLLVIGSGVASIVEELKQYGAARIHVADAPALDRYLAETWAHVAAEVAKESDAKIVAMSAGTTGKDLMPRVAVKLKAGMASAVLGFDGERFSREMWAGSVLATVEITTDIVVATVQSTAFDAAEAVASESTVVPVGVSLPPVRTRFVEMHETTGDTVDLTEAKVVVSGGRGMKNAENFKMLEELARLLNASVGATRTAVDSGWLSNDFQVGQTGKIVAPGLYIAVGISGAMQHIAGMKRSKVIVAINKDEEAPIFQVADYGLVANLFEAVPELIGVLKQAKD